MGDIATKQDLGVLRSELRDGMASLRVEIADSRALAVRTVVLSVVASNAALVGLVFTAVQL